MVFHGSCNGSNSDPRTRKWTDRRFALIISSWLDKHLTHHSNMKFNTSALALSAASHTVSADRFPHGGSNHQVPLP
jgi:hypothetical protein